MAGRPSVVIGNPGSLPSVTAMAGALAQAGVLHKYVLSVSESISAELVPSWLPESISQRFQQEFDRRRLPTAISPESVQHEATLLEFLGVALRRSRIGRRPSRFVLDRRNEVFDRRLSQHLGMGDTAVIATAGGALSTLRRARQLSVATFLQYTVAHHRFAHHLLSEEAKRTPEYADTLQFHDHPPRKLKRLEEEIELADRIFVLSNFQARTFEQSGIDSTKLIVTPLGVDLDMFTPATRSPDGTFRIAFVGQITQRKGISYLIDGFQEASIPGSELVLVGRVVGTDRPWAGRPGLRHVSHVPRWELPAIYASADVFVLPSLIEGFGLTAVEAMASGLPIIVSDNTFGTDLVTDGHDGLIVPIRDSSAIAQRLRYLHDHPGERTRIGRAARQRATDFSWERYGEQVVNAVNSIS